MADPLLRHPVRYRAKTRKRRTLLEAIGARSPRLASAPTVLMCGLGPRSRLRRLLALWWVQISYEIVNRRDFDLALVGTHPETRISWTGDVHEAIPPDLVGREFRGHEGWRRAWSAWLDAFEDLTIRPAEVSDPGGNRLLVGFRSVGRGTASGIPVEQFGFTLYTFEDGLVARQQFFTDREQAEREAGLGE